MSMPRRSRPRLSSAICCAALLVAPSLSTAVETSESAQYAAARASIHSEELHEIVAELADDRYEGRKAGETGGLMAGDYLAAEFERLGLSPGGDDGTFFQHFKGAMRNVVAKIDGGDPEASRELIVIAAHYDHVGRGAKGLSRGTIGSIHNGADDNASGVSALLETAEAFTMLPPSARTVYFVAFDGEETGLNGSKHWLQSDADRAERVVAMLNADMIGQVRNDKLIVYGWRTTPGLREVIGRANDEPELDIQFEWRVVPNSDHYTFVEHERPALLFHSGLTNDYHTERDDAETLDYDGVRRAARLMFGVAYRLACDDTARPFRAESLKENDATRNALIQRALAPPLRLGVEWENVVPREEGVKLVVSRVRRGQAGHAAGLKVGDGVMELDGRPITSGDAFRTAVLTATRDLRIGIERSDEETPLELTVAPGGEPVPFGLLVTFDETEPDVAIVADCLPDSPAAKAGLQANDRVLTIAGRACRDRGVLSNAHERGGAYEIEFERDGRIRHATIDTGRNAA